MLVILALSLFKLYLRVGNYMLMTRNIIASLAFYQKNLEEYFYMKNVCNLKNKSHFFLFECLHILIGSDKTWGRFKIMLHNKVKILFSIANIF